MMDAQRNTVSPAADDDVDYRAIVSAAVGEVGAVMWVAPLALAEELATALTGPAVRDVLRIRAEQIAKHGHDREYDAMLPVMHLPKLAKWFVNAAVEHITGTEMSRDLPMARKRLVKATALCLAAIDRLDATDKGNAQHGA